MQAVKFTSQRTLIALFAASAVGLGIAQAQTAAPAAAPPHTTTMASAGTQLTIRDIYDRLEAAGYREIREIEWDDGRYEAKARTAQGERVKLYLNATTGAVESLRTRNVR